jgi:hypothetical protein
MDSDYQKGNRQGENDNINQFHIAKRNGLMDELIGAL